jgi:putative two-component system response regulator
MHDIGKIGIPDHILLKPGKFEPPEWDIMKTHSQIGADILSGSDTDLMNMAREIALTHHEKWDGTGYPHALAGDNIPLTGRIVAIADVFDALTSIRPYKKAWPVDEAVAYIKEQSGRHFEPRLVEHFGSNLEQILIIKDKYAEPGTHQ